MRWTRFVADEALKRKIGFAYWDFCAEFAVYDTLRNHWIDGVKDALLPLQLPNQ
jgi:endoglucanase